MGVVVAPEIHRLLSQRLLVADAELEAYCRRWGIVKLAVYGSVLRDDFAQGSDIDFLYRLDRTDGQSLVEWFGMREELAEMVGRDVDMAEWGTVESEPNWIRRKAILESASTLYVR